LRYARARRSP